jgi:hypothetical protein
MYSHCAITCWFFHVSCANVRMCRYCFVSYNVAYVATTKLRSKLFTINISTTLWQQHYDHGDRWQEQSACRGNSMQQFIARRYRSHIVLFFCLRGSLHVIGLLCTAFTLPCLLSRHSLQPSGVSPPPPSPWSADPQIRVICLRFISRRVLPDESPEENIKQAPSPAPPVCQTAN